MKCETCQALLMDFVSGELSGSTLASATGHIASCARCQGDVQKLREALEASALLPMLTPPESVRAHVREAAAHANAHPTGGDLGKKRGPGPSWWWRVLSRFGELATSPQVAMATVLLLMIAVGTYYLPANEETPQAALSPLDPDALEAEKKSEAPVATATALPDSDEKTEGSAAEEEAVAATEEQATQGRGRRPPARAAHKGAVKDRATLGSETKKQRRKPIATAEKAGRSLREEPAAPAPAPPARSKQRSAPAPFPALAESDDSVDGEQAARLESAAGGAPAAGSAASPQAPLAQAQAAFGARRYSEAARLAETALETKGVDAGAAHWVAARSYRAAGDCRRALPHYTTLRSTTRRFPRAWIEGALCLHELGDTAAANTWLGEAEQMPAVRAEAQRVRARFDQAL